MQNGGSARNKKAEEISVFSKEQKQKASV